MILADTKKACIFAPTKAQIGTMIAYIGSARNRRNEQKAVYRV